MIKLICSIIERLKGLSRSVLRQAQGMTRSDPAKDQTRANGDARGGISATHDRMHVVAHGVESMDGLPVSGQQVPAPQASTAQGYRAFPRL